jgi:hypothetical protein
MMTLDKTELALLARLLRPSGAERKRMRVLMERIDAAAVAKAEQHADN